MFYLLWMFCFVTDVKLHFWLFFVYILFVIIILIEFWLLIGEFVLDCIYKYSLLMYLNPELFLWLKLPGSNSETVDNVVPQRNYFKIYTYQHLAEWR